MKKIGIIWMLMMLQFAITAQVLTKVENNAFTRGEKLVFRVYFDSFLTGDLNAAKAVFEIQEDNRKIAGRNTLHVVGTGRTTGAIHLFYKVVDRYETYMDEEAIVPWFAMRRVYESGYTANQDVTFDQYARKAYFVDNKSKRKSTVNFPKQTFDIISAFYFVRTMDFSNAKEGDEYKVNFIDDDTVYISTVKFFGRETINTSLGKFKTLIFKPKVLKGSVFDEEYPLTIWITDDENKIPVYAKSKITVGAVKVELIEAKGLKNNMDAKLE